MPIRPIDLQTLLMQLGQVSKDQAVEKEGALIQSSIQGAAAQKRQVASKEALRGPEEPKDGAGPVAERPSSGERRRGEGEKGEGADEEAPEDEVVRDPQLGTKVDLSG